ncbi:MAG: hypothetical protein JNK15_23300 [Planctomycetes bacterium]|nr:hypothetical protein [Planctomycetota bacterium]
MRLHALLVPITCAACAGTPMLAPKTRPDVALVQRLDPGTRFTSALGDKTPDEPRWRAAAVWWREALRQTVAFELVDGDQRDLPVVELTLDPATRALASTWRTGTTSHVLAGDSFAADELPQALDRLAWKTRLALGEDAPPPVPVADGTTRDAQVLLAVADAELLLRDGGFQAAARLLATSRARDGGAPFLLDPIAALALLRGEAAAAERIAKEALGYDTRLLPTTRHRLARTLLQARASVDPAKAAGHDAELLQFGRVARQERPHDPQPALTVAIAHVFRSEFAEARPLLQDLVRRLPEHPIVAYHLGWACLGSGAPDLAVEPLADAAARLPIAWTLLPQAIALFEAGRHDDLDRLLGDLLRDDSAEAQALGYDVRRLSAAHALLRGDLQQCRERLLATFDWLAQNPGTAADRAGELAEQGAVLVRLGGDARLPALLATFQAQHPGSAVAEAAAFVHGLWTVHGGGPLPAGLRERLARGGDSPFAALLDAFAHERAGELADRLEALTRAANLSSSPMTKALFARCLAQSGRTEEGARLLQTVRAEMRTLALRQRCRHPLLGPELAFAASDHAP